MHHLNFSQNSICSSENGDVTTVTPFLEAQGLESAPPPFVEKLGKLVAIAC